MYKPNQNDIQILRLKTVCQKTGLSKASIYRLMKQGLFPQSRKIGLRATGWLADEIDTFLISRETGK